MTDVASSIGTAVQQLAPASARQSGDETPAPADANDSRESFGSVVRRLAQMLGGGKEASAAPDDQPDASKVEIEPPSDDGPPETEDGQKTRAPVIERDAVATARTLLAAMPTEPVRGRGDQTNIVSGDVETGVGTKPGLQSVALDGGDAESNAAADAGQNVKRRDVPTDAQADSKSDNAFDGRREQPPVMPQVERHKPLAGHETPVRVEAAESAVAEAGKATTAEAPRHQSTDTTVAARVPDRPPEAKAPDRAVQESPRARTTAPPETASNPDTRPARFSVVSRETHLAPARTDTGTSTAPSIPASSDEALVRAPIDQSEAATREPVVSRSAPPPERTAQRERMAQAASPAPAKGTASLEVQGPDVNLSEPTETAAKPAARPTESAFDSNETEQRDTRRVDTRDAGHRADTSVSRPSDAPAQRSGAAEPAAPITQTAAAPGGEQRGVTRSIATAIVDTLNSETVRAEVTSEAARTQAQEPAKVMTVRIDLADKGAVNVRMSLKGGALSLNFHAERGDVADQIRHEKGALVEALSAEGYDAELLSVENRRVEAGTPSRMDATTQGSADHRGGTAGERTGDRANGQGSERREATGGNPSFEDAMGGGTPSESNASADRDTGSLYV